MCHRGILATALTIALVMKESGPTGAARSPEKLEQLKNASRWSNQLISVLSVCQTDRLL